MGAPLGRPAQLVVLVRDARPRASPVYGWLARPALAGPTEHPTPALLVKTPLVGSTPSRLASRSLCLVRDILRLGTELASMPNAPLLHQNYLMNSLNQEFINSLSNRTPRRSQYSDKALSTNVFIATRSRSASWRTF